MIYVPDGNDFDQIIAAQRTGPGAATTASRPRSCTRPIKGWQYGIEGRASHGAGPQAVLGRLLPGAGALRADGTARRCRRCDRRAPLLRGRGRRRPSRGVLWDGAVGVVRRCSSARQAMVAMLAGRLARRARPAGPTGGRAPRDRRAATSTASTTLARAAAATIPAELALEPGTAGDPARRARAGAQLLQPGERRRPHRGRGRPAGLDQRRRRGRRLPRRVPERCGRTPTRACWRRAASARTRCAAILSGLSTSAGTSASARPTARSSPPLGHIAARLHAIGNQAGGRTFGDPYQPVILICAHAGLKTGEDGPTHADPQPLQLLQENFPPRHADHADARGTRRRCGPSSPRRWQRGRR